jgi:hypothetical protein
MKKLFGVQSAPLARPRNDELLDKRARDSETLTSSIRDRSREIVMADDPWDEFARRGQKTDD